MFCFPLPSTQWGELVGQAKNRKEKEITTSNSCGCQNTSILNRNDGKVCTELLVQNIKPILYKLMIKVKGDINFQFKKKL